VGTGLSAFAAGAAFGRGLLSAAVFDVAIAGPSVRGSAADFFGAGLLAAVCGLLFKAGFACV